MGKTKIQEWHLRRPIIVESTPFRVETYRPPSRVPFGRLSRVLHPDERPLADGTPQIPAYHS
jgi:hypothetical protein